jgi:hypothetical protein
MHAAAGLLHGTLIRTRGLLPHGVPAPDRDPPSNANADAVDRGYFVIDNQ